MSVPMNNDSEDDLFLQEMGDVKPINVEKKVVLRRDADSALAREARREAATRTLSRDNNHLASDYVELLDPYYPLEYQSSGLQHGVYKKLKQGKYPAEARLDLHRMTVELARREVFEFIKECAGYDLRSLMIIHGKGSHNQQGERKSDAALLKSYVNNWLRDLPEVQAFCSAQPQHGGLGAVYVLLRKSERKKQQNRDRISRGRTIAG